MPRHISAWIYCDDDVMNRFWHRIFPLQVDPCREMHQAILDESEINESNESDLQYNTKSFRRTAIFFTSSECSVAEQTIICKRLPSEVIFGARLCKRLINSPWPCCNNPSASSKTRKRQWVKSKFSLLVSSSNRPGVPTTMSTCKQSLSQTLRNENTKLKKHYPSLKVVQLFFYRNTTRYQHRSNNRRI